MKYWQARKLSPQKFKRRYGVEKRTVYLMVRLVKKQRKQKKKLGRPFKIIIENQILITLQYWREYRTYFHIAQEWKVDESTIYRSIKKVENILIKSRKFNLPGKKELLKYDSENNLIVMDVMESSLEKPKQKQKSFFSGKKKEHTLKTQIVIEQKTKRILCLAHGKGKTHDFKLFKNSGVKFNKHRRLIADKGYQGIKKIHRLSETPHKKLRGQELTKEHKKSNRELNRIRIVIEHVNRRMKIFKILSCKYRNRHRRFGLRINLIAGIYNYELA